MEEVKAPEGKPIRLLEWLVKVDDWIKYGKPVAVYRHIEDPSTGVKTKELHLKSRNVGRVKKLSLEIGQVAMPGHTLMELESCTHPVVMKDMCAECGQDLRLLEERKFDDCARVAMVPNIPELKINNQQAEELGNQDKERLHKLRKLVLLVDLDQTLIHTTQNQAFASMCENNKNFFIYNLNKNEPTLYTKIRPHCREFLEAISKIYELQIVTFGSRQYAHKIAEFIDPEKKYFAHRILSRDECFHPMQKSGNLRHLFPCGDSMVCIIDDRDDVWNAAPNLVLVKKYSYFPGAGDINSPDKRESKKVSADGPVCKNDKLSPRKRKTNSNNEESLCKVRKSKDTPPEDVKENETTTDDVIASPIKQKLATQSEKEDNSSVGTSSSKPDSSDNLVESNDILDDSCASSLPGNNTSDETNPEKDADSSVSNSNNSNDQDKTNLLNADKSESSTIKDNHNGETSGNSTNTCGDYKDAENITKKKDSIENCSPKTSLNSGDTTAVKEKSTTTNSSLTLPDNDDYLLYLQHILSQVHCTYYEAYDKYLKQDFEVPPDLRGVLPFLRSKVLFDCHIVLTGVVPSNFKGRPEQHKAHTMATQLGAAVSDKVNEQTTHLVGGKKGTAKYQEALKLGTVKLVSPDWLWSCSERWEKVSEELFPIPIKKNNSACSSREGTPPVSKTVKWGSDSSAKTYNPVTGKLIKKVLDPSSELSADEVVRQRERKRAVEIYSSLEDPEAVVPLKVEVSSQPSTSAAAVRTRKPSMAEVMGIEYSLSSNDWSEMGKEVDDLLSSDGEDAENNLGTLIENTASSSSEASGNQVPPLMEEVKREDESSSSSEEEFDHMAEMLDHEMHYDEENSRDLEALD